MDSELLPIILICVRNVIKVLTCGSTRISKERYLRYTFSLRVLIGLCPSGLVELPGTRSFWQTARILFALFVATYHNLCLNNRGCFFCLSLKVFPNDIEPVSFLVLTQLLDAPSYWRADFVYFEFFCEMVFYLFIVLILETKLRIGPVQYWFNLSL